MESTTNPAWSDQDLVMACLRGNQQAWDAIVHKYKDLVYAEPIRHDMSPQEAADIFQQVWLETYADLANLGKPGALRARLMSITVRKCHQWARRPQEESHQPDLSEAHFTAIA